MKTATNAQQQSLPGRLWRRWRFHLNILLVLVPLAFMPRYFQDAALFRGDTGLGERESGVVNVGPWSLTLAELRAQAPQSTGPGGYFKAFNAALCEACISDVKATYVRVGKPRSLRAAGALFFGSPYRMGASLPVPTRAKPDDSLWITMEGWDGTVHQGSIPLAEASPATVAWLKTQGDNQ